MKEGVRAVGFLTDEEHSFFDSAANISVKESVIVAGDEVERVAKVIRMKALDNQLHCLRAALKESVRLTKEAALMVKKGF